MAKQALSLQFWNELCAKPHFCPPPPHRAATFSDLKAYLAPHLALLDARLTSTLNSDVALIRTIADYIVTAGGKRLRPLLVFLVAEALGASAKDKKTVDLAATVELIHTATLLHDDVVDESSLRRGRATANAAFGNAASVLVGDFLYSRAFQVMVGTGELRVLEILSEATNRIAEGEVMQLMALGKLDLTETDYLQVIDAKTAKLFEAAGSLGAISAGASAVDEQAMAAYARELGVAFQIADDVLDYRGDAAELGKALGDDLAEGKLTLPIIIALQTSDENTKALLTKSLNAPAAADMSAVMHALEASGALEASLVRARAAASSAAAHLAQLPESTAKHWLLALTVLAVNRQT